jgi:hypothetical protein
VALFATLSAAQARAGCACDGDVNDNGVINILDVAGIVDCVRFNDCDQCVNSCDVNCDGDIDYRDPGAAWCQFLALPDCCARPNGACTPGNQANFGSCIYTQEEFCEGGMLGGGSVYHGSNTVCSPSGVPVVIPAASEWGLLALSLSVLIGGTLLLRSRRPTAC